VRGDETERTLQQDVVDRAPTTTAWVNSRCWANNPGGAIVVPNEHIENMYAVPRDLAADIHETTRRLALAMKRAFSCGGISTRQHNEPDGQQEVWHYHLHVFPRFSGDNLYRSSARWTTPDEREPYVRALREALLRVD
jgi:histidine triad (HIT) family protein